MYTTIVSFDFILIVKQNEHPFKLTSYCPLSQDYYLYEYIKIGRGISPSFRNRVE